MNVTTTTTASSKNGKRKRSKKPAAKKTIEVVEVQAADEKAPASRVRRDELKLVATVARLDNLITMTDSRYNDAVLGKRLSEALSSAKAALAVMRKMPDDAGYKFVTFTVGDAVTLTESAQKRYSDLYDEQLDASYRVVKSKGANVVIETAGGRMRLKRGDIVASK